METPFQPKIELENMGPEVRSYIYQTILEFENFTTPNTTVAVVAKDPLKLIQQEEFADKDPADMKKMWRIAISLSEEGTQIEEEAVHEDIYVAIHMAKDKLLKALLDIQDQFVSNQDRIMQINNALAGTQLH